jgi:hypothetical protein
MQRFPATPARSVDTSGIWVSEDGVAHTVSLAKPQQLMTKKFRRALDQLHSMLPVQVERVLDEAEDSLFSDGDAIPDEPDVFAHYEGRPPPVKILRGHLTSPENLAASLDRVERRWRLDAVMALQDYIA